ncbi:LOW QUALITY PROTEIN: hypothetical protein Bca4012_051916 [Brassica carinata]
MRSAGRARKEKSDGWGGRILRRQVMSLLPVSRKKSKKKRTKKSPPRRLEDACGRSSKRKRMLERRNSAEEGFGAEASEGGMARRSSEGGARPLLTPLLGKIAKGRHSIRRSGEAMMRRSPVLAFPRERTPVPSEEGCRIGTSSVARLSKEGSEFSFPIRSTSIMRTGSLVCVPEKCGSFSVN